MLSVVRYVREYRLGEFIKEGLRRVRDGLLAFGWSPREGSELLLHRQHDAPKGLDIGGAMPRKLDDDGGDKHLKDDAARQELFGVNLAHFPGSRFLRGDDTMFAGRRQGGAVSRSGA